MAKGQERQITSPYDVVSSNPLSLKLDPHNPRLSVDEEGSSQPTLLGIMIERFKIDELATSVIANGYSNFDPLVGYKDGHDIVILEGNRRIATLKLLLNPELAPATHRASWTKMSGELSEDVRTAIDRVDVRVYRDRDAVDVTGYIGFRHVTGVLQWPALEKAEFIARLVEQHGWSYREIAGRLGSYPKHVERHYVAHQVVAQARDEGLTGTENMEKTFGVLLRALQAGGIGDFLGVKYPGDPKKSRRPVPATKVENLADFVRWTFGTSDSPRVLADSRDLTKWGKILSSAPAVAYLKRAPKPDFQRAWMRSGGQKETLEETLFAAADRLEEAVPLVAQHRSDRDVQKAVTQCAMFFAQIITHFPAIQKDQGLSVKHA